MASLADHLVAGLAERGWRVRGWAQAWADDINRRMYTETLVADEDEEFP